MKHPLPLPRTTQSPNYGALSQVPGGYGRFGRLSA